MKIVLLGMPSSGKGTMGALLAEHYDLPLVGLGKFLRGMPQDHPRYEEVQRVMASGGLVANDLVCEIMREHLTGDEFESGYILDGYPRDINQLHNFSPEVDFAIFVDVSIEELKKRITGRRLCTSDGKTYNIYTLPKEELEKCEGELVQRPDDSEEAVAVRFNVYFDKTKPAVDYYKDNPDIPFFVVDGHVSPEEVAQQAIKAIDSHDQN